MKNQEQIIFNHLDKAGSISAVEAIALYKIRSLTSRISRLRKKGVGIEATRKTDLTGQRYVRYYYFPSKNSYGGMF